MTLVRVAVYEGGKKIGSDFRSIMDNAIMYETAERDRSSGGRFSSKLIALEWANCWVEVAKKGQDEGLVSCSLLWCEKRIWFF